MLYEFITPSDCVTFKAGSNKIAYLCALIVGSGKAGCTNIDNDENLGTMMMFSKEPEKEIEEYLGCSMVKFTEDNIDDLFESLKSFAYTSPSERYMYDKLCDKITDKKELEDFKKEYEDKARTSISKIVLNAWSYADDLLKNKEKNEKQS